MAIDIFTEESIIAIRPPISTTAHRPASSRRVPHCIYIAAIHATIPCAKSLS